MAFAGGRLLHTLPEDNSVWGVTSLDSLLFVLNEKRLQQISVYDTHSYRLLRLLNVPGLGAMADMVSCAHYHCIYISGFIDKCVHRVALLQGGAVTKWQIDEEVRGLSVTKTHSVLATCVHIHEIREFSTSGTLLRRIQLAQDVLSPWHAIQLSGGQFIVCHGGRDDPVHRVCLIGSDGNVLKSYGGVRTTRFGQST